MKITATDMRNLAKAWVKPVPEGTPVRNVVNPAVAWAVGISPMPCPAEMHAPIEPAENPAPEHASQATKRLEWRAHKAAERALKKGTLQPLDGGPKNRRPYPDAQMHHPDYRKPLEIAWESPKVHPGLSHLPKDRGQEEERQPTPAEIAENERLEASIERLQRAFGGKKKRNPALDAHRLRLAFRALGIRPRNPELLGFLRRAPRSNPAGTLEEARQQSEEFHGSPNFVEMFRGRPVVKLGTIPELDYDVPAGSQRRGPWTHGTGDDLGPLGTHVKRKVKKPELVVDVATGKPEIDARGTPMHFDPRAGLRE